MSTFTTTTKMPAVSTNAKMPAVSTNAKMPAVSTNAKMPAVSTNASSWTQLYENNNLEIIALGKACALELIITFLKKLEDVSKDTHLFEKAFFPLLNTWKAPLKQLYTMAFDHPDERMYNTLKMLRTPTNRIVALYDENLKHGENMARIPLGQASIVLIARALEDRLVSCLNKICNSRKVDDWSGYSMNYDGLASAEFSEIGETFIKLTKKFLGDFNGSGPSITIAEHVQNSITSAKEISIKQRDAFMATRNFAGAKLQPKLQPKPNVARVFTNVVENNKSINKEKKVHVVDEDGFTSVSKSVVPAPLEHMH